MLRMSKIEHETPTSKLIDKIGVTGLAQALGHRNVSTVHSWKTRGSIPVVHWDSIIKCAREMGVDGVDIATLATANGVSAGPDRESAPADPAQPEPAGAPA
jgi:hypothetical protein